MFAHGRFFLDAKLGALESCIFFASAAFGFALVEALDERPGRIDALAVMI